MESPIERAEALSDRGLEHPLAACILLAALVALATLAVTSHPNDPAAPPAFEAAPPQEISVAPSREALRSEFFDREVEPRIAETDRMNREAADRCVQRLSGLMNRYRDGVEPFVEDLTSMSTRLGIVRRMPGNWWKQDARVESYVQEKFEHHLFSEATLARDVGGILDSFRTEVDANQKRMLISIRASLDTADLPEVAIEDYDRFLASVADRLQGYSSQQGTSSVQNALAVLVMSEAGSYAAVSLASGLLARFGTAAATTAAATGGATAGASAAGAGSGSLGGPVGTAVGLGVGLVIGLAIDWWMTEKFEDELGEKMRGYIDSLEQSILHGSPSQSSAENHPFQTITAGASGMRCQSCATDFEKPINNDFGIKSSIWSQRNELNPSTYRHRVTADGLRRDRPAGDSLLGSRSRRGLLGSQSLDQVLR